MRVAVYRNLHKGCWSVRNRSTGRVVRHMDSLMVHDCEFRVGKAGRQRVLMERRKNVHAFVHGNLLDSPNNLESWRIGKGWIRVTYDPYESDKFVTMNGRKPVERAEAVILLSDGRVYALDTDSKNG
jgi:hypothetical protein